MVFGVSLGDEACAVLEDFPTRVTLDSEDLFAHDGALRLNILWGVSSLSG